MPYAPGLDLEMCGDSCFRDEYMKVFEPLGTVC